jgi:hypothetical protein
MIIRHETVDWECRTSKTSNLKETNTESCLLIC